MTATMPAVPKLTAFEAETRNRWLIYTIENRNATDAWRKDREKRAWREGAYR